MNEGALIASRAGGCQRPGEPPVPASLSTVPVPCQEIPMIRMRTDFFAESLVMGTSMVVLMPQAAAGIGMEGADGAGGADGPGGSDAAGGADADGVPVLYLLHGLSDDCTIWERRTAIERSEEHTSELQSRGHLVCRLLLEIQKIIRFSVIRC